jgi:hypothetical protein
MFFLRLNEYNAFRKQELPHQGQENRTENIFQVEGRIHNVAEFKQRRDVGKTIDTW